MQTNGCRQLSLMLFCSCASLPLSCVRGGENATVAYLRGAAAPSLYRASAAVLFCCVHNAAPFAAAVLLFGSDETRCRRHAASAGLNGASLSVVLPQDVEWINRLTWN